MFLNTRKVADMINSSKWLFLLLLVDLNVFVHSNADKSHTLLNDWQSYLQNHSKEPRQNAMQILARVNRYLQQNAQDQNIRHLQCKIFHYLGKSDSLLVYGKRFLDHWPHSECSEEIRYDLFDLFCKRNQHDLAQAMMTKLRMRRWRYSALMTLERAAKGASQDSITTIRLGAESLWLNSCFDTLCLPGIDGNKVQLAQFNSPCVLITWTPWCELTRAKLPAIKRLQHALQNQPITWIFLAFDSTPQEVKTFLSTTPLQGVHTVQGEKYAGHLGLEGFPLYAVFNRQGVLIDKSVSGSARRVLYEWYLYGLLKIMHNCDTSPRWFELKGDHALVLKDTLSAIAFYQQSLEQNPRHIELGRKLLEIYKQKQLIDSAQRLAIANADILLEDQEFALTIDPGYLQFQLHVLLSFFARFPLHQAELYDQLDSLYHITESPLIPPKSVKQECREQLFEKKMNG
ncbi:redoxin domain-containing protein [candidate division KSB1 bacterium]|nr:redoxin domain-containing protein [candidate division KSB1 bacterium]